MGRPDSDWKRILVVGGAGFLGSHLCRRLVGQGHKVFCVDNLITGNLDNISDLLKLEDFFTFYEGCAEVSGEIDFACDYHIDEIYYLASIASPEHYVTKPLETIYANVYGLQNALELAAQQKAKLLYASTSEVYGNPECDIQSEFYFGNVDCNSDRAVYDESKRLGETLVSLFRRRYNGRNCIVRIFNTYGPNMAVGDGRVIPNFIEQCLNNKPRTIYGDGKQTRSFCYVTDMVDGIIKAMDFCHKDPINLGNPAEYYSIEELARLISNLMGVTHETTQQPYPTMRDPVIRRPHVERAKQSLKWEPKTGIKKGLKETIEWFRSQHGSTRLGSNSE